MRYSIVAVIAGLLLLEVAARLSGFGAALLYEKTVYGYRVAPNQTVTRWGRSIRYNDLGLRNDAVSPLPGEGVLRILCLGDSITFGGTLTDQEDTYPHQLQRALSGFAMPPRKIEVLNASAGGWGIENVEGWLAAQGTLGAQWLVLQVATHDLFQPQTGSEIVGTHLSFPDRQPIFALGEVVHRYVLPKFAARSQDPGVILDTRGADAVQRALNSIQRIHALAKRSNTRILVMFVEQPRAFEPMDELTRWAKERLRQQVSKLGLRLIEPAAAIERAGGARLFRDTIHPNEQGNRVLAQEVGQALKDARELRAVEAAN